MSYKRVLFVNRHIQFSPYWIKQNKMPISLTFFLTDLNFVPRYPRFYFCLITRHLLISHDSNDVHLEV